MRFEGLIIVFGIFALLLLVLIIVLPIFIKEDINKKIKCKKCGTEIDCNEKNVIVYRFQGNTCKSVECPKCHNYIEI